MPVLGRANALSGAAPVRAVLWDNDGVLVDTEVLYFRATRDVMREAGGDLSVAQFRRFFLTERRGAWHLLEGAGMGEERVAALREIRNRRYADLLRSEPITVPGAADALRTSGVSRVTGVVTSSRREHFELIHARTGLAGCFDFVVANEDVARTKPDPEPYLKAVHRAGAPPAECLAIEDSERGLIAAKRAGLRCWVIPTDLTRGGEFSAADRILGSVHEVPALLGPFPAGGGPTRAREAG